MLPAIGSINNVEAHGDRNLAIIEKPRRLVLISAAAARSAGSQTAITSDDAFDFFNLNIVNVTRGAPSPGVNKSLF